MQGQHGRTHLAEPTHHVGQQFGKHVKSQSSRNNKKGKGRYHEEIVAISDEIVDAQAHARIAKSTD
jgi:hypothetical protein